ncbi:MAG: GNAT family N-acetyltransferase [Bacillota bacterium]
MKVIIERAYVSDAEEILSLQKLAYTSEAAIYNDYAIEPLVQSLKEVQEQFKDHVFQKAFFEGTIVGSVRGWLKEGTCYIGKLIVHPNYQNMGIGKQLMSEIESFFNVSLRFELFTGNKSEKNLQLYKKLGYKIFKTETINENLSIVYLEKRRFVH